jgi:hypothetical protein
MNAQIIKLITGEELLAEVVSTDTVLRIKNPVRIIVMPNKIDPKTPNIGFAPWAEFSDDKEFTLDKSHIVAIMTPIKEFVNQYSSMFGGLVVPKSNLILPG